MREVFNDSIKLVEITTFNRKDYQLHIFLSSFTQVINLTEKELNGLFDILDKYRKGDK